MNWEALCAAQTRVRELETMLEAQRKDADAAMERLEEEMAACQDQLAECQAGSRHLETALEEANANLENGVSRAA